MSLHRGTWRPSPICISGRSTISTPHLTSPITATVSGHKTCLRAADPPAPITTHTYQSPALEARAYLADRAASSRQTHRFRSPPISPSHLSTPQHTQLCSLQLCSPQVKFKSHAPSEPFMPQGPTAPRRASCPSSLETRTLQKRRSLQETRSLQERRTSPARPCQQHLHPCPQRRSCPWPSDG